MAGFRKAAPEQAFLKLALYGPPGSGKTMTTLLVAEGLAARMGKRVAFVDTERGTDFYAQAVPDRAVHPEAFDFDALYTRSVTELLKAVRGLDTDAYGVLCLDSVTHIWEACKMAYNGYLTRAGTIPFQAWAQIKKPYKDLLNLLLNHPVHVILCGRQGIEYGEDDKSGELKVTGKKMKAEGETPYEPHILARMESVKGEGRKTSVSLWVEKDRTGVLQGRTIIDPSFETLAAPLLPLLGLKQAQIEDDEHTATRDAEAMAQQEREKAEMSQKLLDEWGAKLQLAGSKGLKEVEKVSKQITPELKKQMLAGDVAALREKYLEASRRAKGGNGQA
jgi:hypothetical protein